MVVLATRYRKRTENCEFGGYGWRRSALYEWPSSAVQCPSTVQTKSGWLSLLVYPAKCVIAFGLSFLSKHGDDSSPHPDPNQNEGEFVKSDGLDMIPTLKKTPPVIEPENSKEKPQALVEKGSELQVQLSIIQEDLKKAKELTTLIEKEKAQVLEELKQAQSSIEGWKKMAESYAGNLVELWKRNRDDLEKGAKEANKLEEKVAALEMIIKQQKTDLEELKEERAKVLNNENIAAYDVPEIQRATIVGECFVWQYYQTLQRWPYLVHQFYCDSSTMLRVDGSNRQSASTVLQIHALMTSLNFSGVKITAINSEDSWNGGVHVVVSGVAVKDYLEGARKFIEIFFLAPQEFGYVVLNNIFRFVEEETVQHGPIISPVQINLDAEVNSSHAEITGQDPLLTFERSDASQPIMQQAALTRGSSDYSCAKDNDEVSPIEHEDEVRSVYVRNLLPHVSEAEIGEEFKKFAKSHPMV